MDNPLTLKLDQFVKLSIDDRIALEVLTREPQRNLAMHQNIIEEGDAPAVVNLILQGWACRYKLLKDGRRQIIAIFLPGDLCDLHVFILRRMDHSIGTLTPVRYVEITRERFDTASTDRPQILRALWFETLVTAAVQREWTVSLGQRSAEERLAHLFCELFYRLRAVGRTVDHHCDMPLTQVDLADATGLSAVHVNRVLQRLRGRSLIRWRGRQFEILDLKQLMEVALFNPNYLHYEYGGALIEADEP